MIDEYVLIPTGETCEKFNGIMTLSETGAFIYEHIEEAKSFEELIQMILNEYEIDEKNAISDAISFINKMLQLEIIELTDKNSNW